ncbi:MAG: NAD(P)/FAD-dependent oxidoreductase [Aestuariibacter sp.]
MKADVLIIGGGLMGFSSALHLALRGKSCVVIEKDSPGRHASGVNAGGLRRLNRHPAEIPLAVAAAEKWQNIAALVGSHCDAVFPGQIRVAENDDDLAKLFSRAEVVQNIGYQHEEIIGKNTLYQMLPNLIPGCVGGLLCRGDGYARPFHALTAFRDRACELGVKYFQGTEVLDIDKGPITWTIHTNNGKFSSDVLLNCAGAWAHKIAEKVGDSAPITPKAPMMMVTERLPHFIEPVVGAASRKLSFKQMQNGTLLIGGAHLATLDMEQESTQMNWRKLAVSARSVLALFPQLKNVHIVRTWAGIEAFTPDSLPIICPSTTASQVFHCFGFSAHGFQLSPVVGQIMSELVIDGQTSFPIEPFNIDRF